MGASPAFPLSLRAFFPLLGGSHVRRSVRRLARCSVQRYVRKSVRRSDRRPTRLKTYLSPARYPRIRIFEVCEQDPAAVTCKTNAAALCSQICTTAPPPTTPAASRSHLRRLTAVAVPARRLPSLSASALSLPLGKLVPEMGTIRIWDPGIVSSRIGWDFAWAGFGFALCLYVMCLSFVVLLCLSLVVSESWFFGYPTRLPFGLNKQDKDLGRHFIGEIKFSLRPGFWAIKNIKDALKSSILLYRPLNHRLEVGCGFQKRVIGITVLVLMFLFSGFMLFRGLILFSFEGRDFFPVVFGLFS